MTRHLQWRPVPRGARIFAWFRPDWRCREGQSTHLCFPWHQGQILPFETTSRRLVPDLKQAGYRVNFQEFDGPHAMPPEIARGAIEWFLK